MSRLGSKVSDYLHVSGQSLSAAVAGAAAAVNVLMRDGNDDILWATGTGVPADNSVGYAKSCLFIDTNVGAGTGSLYLNKGTNALAAFTLVTQA